MNDILNFLDTIAPVITIVAFALLWYQIRSLKKIAPKEEEWARNVQTMSKQFAELEENISKGKFGDTQNVKEIGTVIGNLNQSVESLWQTMKKTLKLTEK
jgi:uncharacterized protein YoxC